MKYKFWLDDCRPVPSKEWTLFVKAEDLIATLKICFEAGTPIEVISLDNDLGDGLMEGYKVLDWLESLQMPIDFGVQIHSANPVARERMRAIIQRNGWTEVM